MQNIFTPFTPSPNITVCISAYYAYKHCIKFFI